jgi:voltage-gated potassium channel Kch
MLAYERISAKLEAAHAPPPPDDPTFDDAEPDIIVAGLGRFGQITARLLLANGFRTTALDSDIEQIEVLRKFGRPVHYGDATRLDLLRAAGAERARMLVVAIDDQEKAVELVETAKKAFPNMIVLARAFDRRHAYDLLRKGADIVERETFEGALKMGVEALKKLGFRAHRAHRAGDYFRRHDLHSFEELAPMWGTEDNYILAARDSQQTMEKLLAADLERMKPTDTSGWDTSSLDEELRERAVGDDK